MSRMFGARRRERASLASACLVAVGLLVSAEDASAFCRSTTCRSTKSVQCQTDENDCPLDGERLYWPTSCISYAVNKIGTARFDPEDTRAVIRKTFQAWSDVPCPNGSIAAITFQEREPVTCKKSQYNKTTANLNVVFFEDSTWIYRGIDATLAKTSVTYNDDTGEIYDADIAINTAFNQFTLTDDPEKAITDLQAVLTHEVGHFIGIAHSNDPDAVMFASYSPGSLTQRQLSPDDVRAVCAAYPAAEAETCNTEPRNGFSGTCAEPEEAPGLCSIQPTSNAGGHVSYGVAAAGFASAGLLTAFVRRRRRRALPVRDSEAGERT
jgi:MYXO-CTERM domain-containing protein